MVAQKNETDMSLDQGYVKPLLPLEYCSIDRAARLLGCEVGDIGHWIQIGAVKAFFKFNRRQRNDDGSVLQYRIEGQGLELDDLDDFGRFQTSVRNKYCEFYTDTWTYNADPDSMELDDVYTVSMYGTPTGVWEIDQGYEFWEELFNFPEEVGEGAIFLCSQVMSSGSHTYWCLEYPLKVSLSEVVLLREDLLKLHSAIQLGTDVAPLENRYNSQKIENLRRDAEKKKQPAEIKERVEARQCEVIRALIESIDELGPKALAKKSMVHELVNTYFVHKDVRCTVIDPRTMTRWIKKAEEIREKKSGS